MKVQEIARAVASANGNISLAARNLGVPRSTLRWALASNGKAPKKNKEILIIPDSHATPEHNNDRFTWAGNFALKRRPDYIVDIGDSADMASLCSYDTGTVSAEGRRYADDIEAYKDAQRKFFAPIHKHNKNNPTDQFEPTLIKCTGNHEQRIIRAANEDPRLHGHLQMSDLEEESFGWDVYPFLTPVEIEGIAFQHYITSGVMGRPIGGENHAATLVKKGYRSVVVGHSHMRDFWETTDILGNKLFGLVCGVYVDQDHGYTTEQRRWWSGLVYLHDVCNGKAEPEFLAIDYLKREFS